MPRKKKGVAARPDLAEAPGSGRGAIDPHRHLGPVLKAYTLAIDKMRQGLCVFDHEQKLVLFNRRYAEMYDLPPESIKLGMTLRDVVDLRYEAGTGPDMTREEYATWRDQIQVADRIVETIVELRNGAVHEIHHEPTPDGGWVATFDDITQRRLTARALVEQQQRLDAALDNMPHGLCLFDAARRLVICNRRYAEMYGLPPEVTEAGTPIERIFGYRKSVGNAPVDASSYAEGTISPAIEGATGEVTTRLEDGRTIHVSYQPVKGGGFVATHQDVTASVRAQERISHLAHHDALTNLPNRVLFRERLTEALRRADGRGSVALLWLDLDHFKSVNDSLGHAAGDMVLWTVAERLRASVRESDTVARLGGDEFVILQVGAEQPSAASALASRVVDVLGEPQDIEGHRLTVGASVGIAIAPSDEAPPDELLKKADLALYQAKSEGRGRFRFFEPGMDEQVRARQALEADLREGLASGQFRLFYQPWCDLESRDILGFEALLRWFHPERGLVPPADFIPLAEETGLIRPLGEWVLRQACSDAATWPAPLKLAVNLSPVQFRYPGLVPAVVSALASSGLSPSRLELEITETCLLQQNDATLATLHQLRNLGACIAMDDFGTGYSSLSYLRSFPFGKLKIDRSFVHGLTGNRESIAIVRALIGLGTSLGISLTAEGVETEAELEALRTEGCTAAQGYLLGRPEPAESVARLLERSQDFQIAV